MKLVEIPIIVVVVSVLCVLAVITLLFLFFISFYKKYKSNYRIKYGFGGKTILPFVPLLLASTTLPILIFSFSKQLVNINKASSIKQVNISFFENQNLQNSEVTFFAQLFIDGKLWGGGEKCDIFWKIKNSSEIEVVERDVSLKKQSSVKLILNYGKYDVKTTFKCNGFEIEKQKTLIIEREMTNLSY